MPILELHVNVSLVADPGGRLVAGVAGSNPDGCFSFVFICCVVLCR
jgi:hypothetical protein